MPKAKTSQNQTLKALRHMAGIDLDEKHTAANCLSAHAAQHGFKYHQNQTLLLNIYIQINPRFQLERKSFYLEHVAYIKI